MIWLICSVFIFLCGFILGSLYAHKRIVENKKFSYYRKFYIVKEIEIKEDK